jgi:FkbM family methyltransferase
LTILNKEHVLPQMLLKLWPFPRGAGRLTDRFFSQLVFSEQLAKVTTTDEFDITVMPNELIGRHLYLTGEFDRSIVEVLCNFADPGDTLLDIGANIGYVSACFLVNIPGSRVIAVEPQPDVVDLLRLNLAPFGQRSKIYPYALSDTNGEAFFNIDVKNRGRSYLSSIGVKVEMRSADSLFDDMGLNKIDLVKIDVEGHEEEVIRSGRQYFARMQPKLVLFEEHGDKSVGSIGAILREIGYHIYGIRKHLTKIRLKPIVSAEDCVFNDYIAISNARAIPSRAAVAYDLGHGG